MGTTQPTLKAEELPQVDWALVERRIPLRLGKPLPLIPFVFHGPRNFLPDVDKLPLGDVIAVIELNTDFSTKGLSAQEVTAVVAAWQNGALSRDSMLDIFRRGEVLPEGRSNEEEIRLVAAAPRRLDAPQRIQGGGQVPEGPAGGQV